MSAPRALASCALLALGALAEPAQAASLEAAPSLTMLLEYDTNARRRAAPEELAGDKAPVGDGLWRARAGVRVRAAALGGRLDVDANLGGKLFFTEHGQSMAVGQVWSGLVRPLPFGLVLTVNELAKLRGQASGRRVYGLSRTDVAVGRGLPFGFFFRGGGYATEFFSVDTPFFSSVEAGPRLEGGMALTRRERVDVDGTVALRGFPLLGAVEPDGALAVYPRADVPVTLGVGFTSVRRLYLQVRYTLTRNSSNSVGDSYTRHRLVATAGVRLPFAITATGQGALQLTSYDDGLSVGQRLFLADDDESQNSLQVAISRPFLWGVHTEARLAWYGNEFARERLRFGRVTASMGLRWEL